MDAASLRRATPADNGESHCQFLNRHAHHIYALTAKVARHPGIGISAVCTSPDRPTAIFQARSGYVIVMEEGCRPSFLTAPSRTCWHKRSSRDAMLLLVDQETGQARHWQEVSERLSSRIQTYRLSYTPVSQRRRRKE